MQSGIASRRLSALTINPVNSMILAALALHMSSGPALAQGAAEPPAGSVTGMGDVNIYPKRVVIDQRQRVASVGLFNRTASASNYDIEISDMGMSPDGQLRSLADVADPALRARVATASKMLRWSPRRVTLNGHDSQTVRIMASVPPGLPPGEYRSHFTAIAVPEGAEGGISISQATGAAPANAIGVTIIPRFGISIPVIVRVGETTLSTGIRDLSVSVNPAGLRLVNLTLTRSGTRSAFGDLEITAPGTKKPIATIKGIGVYTEINERSVQVAVDPQADPRLTARGAKLTVTYIDDDVAPGKILARQDFTVP